MSRPAIEDLLAECLERYETDGQPGVDEVISSHPELADEIESGLAELRALGLLTSDRVFDEDALPRTLGEFERGERIGGGGMGVVFRARQRSLDREVALKVIRPDQLYLDSARERFRREVESVAKLQHESIVPVYAVGETDSVPYLAMELVAGCTLAEALAHVSDARTGADLRDAVVAATTAKGHEPGVTSTDLYAGSWVDTCVRITQCIAKALAHAHACGVLHRDVKPSNVMLTPGGRVLLFDFGLVRTNSAERMTRTGAPVGSPAYMAPEQMRTGISDARSDVYSLGVTMYEMLARELPFLGASYDQLRERVQAGDYVPPRRRNRAVPSDLETICVVAMDVDPGRRYSSASALADDLERYLRRQAIQARQPGPILRAKRFSQRHPTFVVGFLLGVLLCVGTPTALWLQQRTANAQLIVERTTATRRMKLAIATVRRFLTRFATDDVVLVPHMEELAHALLEDAIELFNEVLAEGDEHPAFRGERANALLALAWIHQRLGDSATAKQKASEGVAGYSRLLDAAPDNEQWRFHAADGRSLLGSILLDLGERRVAREHLEAAAADLEALDAAGESMEVKDALALTYARLGALAAAEERRGASAEYYSKVNLLRSYLLRASETPETLFGFAVAQRSMGLSHVRSDQREASVFYHKGAITILDNLLAKHPDQPVYRWELAKNLCNLSARQFDLGEIDEALRVQRRGIEMLEGLVDDFPRTKPWRVQLALELTALGVRHRTTGQVKKAERSLRRAGEVYDSMPDLPPSSWVGRISHYRSLALLEYELGKLDVAADTLRRAIEFAEQHEPERAVTREELARVWNLLGTVERRRKRLGPAMTAYRASLAAHEKLVAAHPDDSEFRMGRASVLHNLATIHRLRRDLSGSIELLRRAVADKRAALAREPEHHFRSYSLANTLHNLAGLLITTGQADEATGVLEDAVACAQKAVDGNPQDSTYRARLVTSCEALSRRYVESGKTLLATKLAERMVASDESDSTPVRAAVLLCRLIAKGWWQESTGKRAVELLKLAAERGYRDVASIEGNALFEPLKERPDLAEVLRAMRERK